MLDLPSGVSGFDPRLVFSNSEILEVLKKCSQQSPGKRILKGLLILTDCLFDSLLIENECF